MENWKKFTLVTIAFVAGMFVAGFLLDFASAASPEDSAKWPIVKIGSKCFKKIYRERNHVFTGNSPAGSLTGCSGCFYGYDSDGRVVMYRPVPCAR